MDLPDSREQVKIWQRVRGETVGVTEGLPALVSAALARANLYTVLSQQMPGPGRSILQQLKDGEQYCIRCLKGVYYMVTGKVMHTASVPLSMERRDAALRKCYGQTLKLLTACDARAQDPEFGAVFSCIAAVTRNHCCKLAELMSLLGV